MTVYPPSEYSFVKFVVASGSSKYVAVLKNKKTSREVRVRFGAKGYEQYKDKALGRYSNLDHGDPKRRASYRARHAGEGAASRKYSPGWFAMHYLW
jgi:hypothetical protein